MKTVRAQTVARCLLKAAALCAALGANLAALAYDDGAAKKTAEGTCAGCHGSMGNNPTVAGAPRLAGQQYEYLRQALAAYHNGSRQNPMMSAIVQPLTPSEIDGLAWYYSRQQGLTTQY
jgi:cytochrome c553